MTALRKPCTRIVRLILTAVLLPLLFTSCHDNSLRESSAEITTPIIIDLYPSLLPTPGIPSIEIPSFDEAIKRADLIALARYDNLSEMQEINYEKNKVVCYKKIFTVDRIISGNDTKPTVKILQTELYNLAGKLQSEQAASFDPNHSYLLILADGSKGLDSMFSKDDPEYQLYSGTYSGIYLSVNELSQEAYLGEKLSDLLHHHPITESWLIEYIQNIRADAQS